MTSLGGGQSGAVEDDGTRHLYSTYVKFKGWREPGRLGDDRDFEYLLSRVAPLAGKNLLDVGFGAGELLDWAKANGAVTFGSELIDELKVRAARRGHAIVAEDLSDVGDNSLDVVTAIDVFEHLPQHLLAHLLAQVALKLRPGGRLIARFPNGSSPFSLPFQNGDLTHVHALTANSLRQLAAIAGLDLVERFNPRPRAHGLAAARRNLAYFVRDVVETIIGYAYFGYRMPLDPNLLVILEPAGLSTGEPPKRSG